MSLLKNIVEKNIDQAKIEIYKVEEFTVLFVEPPQSEVKKIGRVAQKSHEKGALQLVESCVFTPVLDDGVVVYDGDQPKVGARFIGDDKDRKLFSDDSKHLIGGWRDLMTKACGDFFSNLYNDISSEDEEGEIDDAEGKLGG